MSKQLELQNIFIEVLGSEFVYFQPPSTVKMSYPCILYERAATANRASYANGSLYALKKAYTVTIIDADPNSEIPDRVSKLPYCHFENHFTAENLNHDIYTLYY